MNNVSNKVSFTYIITLIILGLIFYLVTPIILNYPPYAFGPEMYPEYTMLSYNSQYLIILLLMVVIVYIIIKLLYYDVDKWELYLRNNDESKILRIRKKCVYLPYITYFILTIVVASILTLLLSIKDIGGGIDDTAEKLIVLQISFLALVNIINFVTTKRILNKILVKTYIAIDENFKPISLKLQTIFQFVPLFIVSLIITSMWADSLLYKQQSSLKFKMYSDKLSNDFANYNRPVNLENIKTQLQTLSVDNAENSWFILPPNTNKVISSDNTNYSNMFVNYTRLISPKIGGRTVDPWYYDKEGATIRINSESGTWIVGITYKMDSREAVVIYVLNFIFFTLLASLVLYYSSKTYSEDINEVSKKINQIVLDKNIMDSQEIPVTSFDEVGMLVTAFNQIQQLTKDNIKLIDEKNKQLLEQERFSSLGQLIGGIAHDMNSRLYALDGQLYLVNNYINEIKNNENLDRLDYIDIANDILKQINEMKTSVISMSKTIDSVRNHTRNYAFDNVELFSMIKVIETIESLLNQKLQRHNCTLTYKQNKEEINIKGDFSKFESVLINIISNSIEAYNINQEKKGGLVEVYAEEKENEIIISVTDHGKGIPENIRDLIFKEVLTTKGANGTGMGLYFSHSIIVGNFNGDIWFDSQVGKGTTFYVRIPK